MSERELGGVSAVASERKGEIYAVLRGELRRRRVRRRVARAGGALAAVCVFAAGAMVVMQSPRGTVAPAGGGGETGILAGGGGDAGVPAGVPLPRPETVPIPIPEGPAAPIVAVRFEVIRTEEGIADRLAARASGRVVVREIGDEELLAALDEAGGGERFGLVRAGSKLAVVCQTCDGSGEGPAWMEELRREWGGGRGFGG